MLTTGRPLWPAASMDFINVEDFMVPSQVTAEVLLIPRAEAKGRSAFNEDQQAEEVPLGGVNVYESAWAILPEFGWSQGGWVMECPAWVVMFRRKGEGDGGELP